MVLSSSEGIVYRAIFLLEYWSAGVMEETNPNTPVLQHSNTPDRYIRFLYTGVNTIEQDLKFSWKGD